MRDMTLLQVLVLWTTAIAIGWQVAGLLAKLRCRIF